MKEAEMPPFRPYTHHERQMLELDEDFIRDIKESPYYLSIPQKKYDIARYTDKYKTDPALSAKRIRDLPCDDLKFFPDELHYIHDPSKKQTTRLIKSDINLDKRLKELEKEEAEKKTSSKDMDDDEEALNDDGYDEEEQEEEDDYQINFYDEDDEGGDDDDDGGDNY
ncbi:hypothetical protein HDU67_009558 [Dinochytrium kinnereticum]|nr:hypothetical protein HDU67_009558 [Dinochytrium kinnereticum]